MKQILLCLFLFSSFSVMAQQKSEREAVIAAVQELFDAMRASDTIRMQAVFHADARLQTTFTDKEGVPQLRSVPISVFIQSVGARQDVLLDEKIWNYDVQVDQNLATAWTEYAFFLDDKFSHCGYNAFQLFKSAKGWKIHQITDTRGKTNCKLCAEDAERNLNDLIDAWHQASATADEEAFFGAMAADGVYIGTDASERWLRDELREWAKFAFERDTAWSFTSLERHITISEDARHAWWDELLDTKMGTCRATGILALENKQWKIKHYQLSLTVPNEKIDDFKKLVEE